MTEELRKKGHHGGELERVWKLEQDDGVDLTAERPALAEKKERIISAHSHFRILELTSI